MAESKLKNGNANKLMESDRVAHDWYRFVLSYPPHLVRSYLEKFGANESSVVLDPFCGTGTTVIECKKLGIRSFGIEAHPMVHFACKVKADWSVAPDRLMQASRRIANRANQTLLEQGIYDNGLNGNRPSIEKLRTLSPEQQKLILKNSISALPLHKSLVLHDYIQGLQDSPLRDHQRLAFAKALVDDIGNLHFGPEVGVRRVKDDAPVVSTWLNKVRTFADDLALLREKPNTPAQVVCADSRQVSHFIEPQSVDFIITSPPYPNEKDYTRTTRLESVLLGFLSDRQELRAMKQQLLRSNTRNVYVKDTDDVWITDNKKIAKIADSIEQRRIDMGKTSGFERLYSRVTRLYFGGMARHFMALSHVLKPGARLAYVVGDQASYLQIMIRTGQLLAEIAQSVGYEVESIDLFRTRLSTATKSQLREEVLVLRWPKRKKRKRTATPN